MKSISSLAIWLFVKLGRCQLQHTASDFDLYLLLGARTPGVLSRAAVLCTAGLDTTAQLHANRRHAALPGRPLVRLIHAASYLLSRVLPSPHLSPRRVQRCELAACLQIFGLGASGGDFSCYGADNEKTQSRHSERRTLSET